MKEIERLCLIWAETENLYLRETQIRTERLGLDRKILS
jgi:hypothetical protein